MCQGFVLEQEDDKMGGKEKAIIFRTKKQDLVDSRGGFVSGRWKASDSDSWPAFGFVALRYLNHIMCGKKQVIENVNWFWLHFGTVGTWLMLIRLAFAQDFEVPTYEKSCVEGLAHELRSKVFVYKV